MKRVLAVDDSPAWRAFHERNIKEIFIELEVNVDDYKLDIASSAREGYDFIIQNNDTPYDVIVTDLQMEYDFDPKLAGEWLAEQVKTFDKYFNTKVILCSGMYNIARLAEKLNVDCIPKRAAVADINQYKDIIMNYLK
ncbi:MAG: hypothetical protein K6E29_00640 [Cyanobacteria bacterium RUI128]|nr:hypothetical protein [Cyanobacteria bacterium RUI128]